MGTPERGALEAQLFDSLCALGDAPNVAAPMESAALAEMERLFDVQVASRHCDLAARWLRGRQKGYYTIGSAGHESNAAVAMA
ncbi:MAG: MFS transporter, partial [Ilumatobacteraceae bacterium]